MSSPRVFLPGSTIGVMGGGQLGRMLALAARRMGYRIHSFSPEKNTPAGQVADEEIAASYHDEAAVRAFAHGVDVLTFEFENIPEATLAWCAQDCEVRPGGRVLAICQHRLREKRFLADAGLPLPAFASVTSLEELHAAVAHIGTPAVLKTAAFGYDGKGQRKIETREDSEAAWASFEGAHAVLEKWIPFAKELSVLIARGTDGATATFPICENRHRHHILDVTIAPGDVPPAVAARARQLASQIAEALELVGLLAVEMFLLPSGELLINELAPRPHNSGHFSFDASVTSQFEQQVRAVCGLPLGSTESLKAAAMANLLGDLWSDGEPDWAAALHFPAVKLHLYGKTEPRAGRKMGHMVALAETGVLAEEQARAARAALTVGRSHAH